MTDMPPEAIEAAAWAIHRSECEATNCTGPGSHDRQTAERSLSAALPHLRAWIANEIDAEARLEAEAYDPEGQPLAAEYREWWHTGMANAAGVARGDQP